MIHVHLLTPYLACTSIHNFAGCFLHNVFFGLYHFGFSTVTKVIAGQLL